MEFNQLFREFEAKNCDVSKFFAKYSENKISTRFLLVRSLDTENLIDVYELATGSRIREKQEKLYELVYNSNITISQLIEYIESQRTKLIETRTSETEDLENIIANYTTVNCGVRNDKIEDIVKGLVRDKSIKTLNELETIIDCSVLPKLRQYILWSFYNQTTNDLIELGLIQNPNIIPTLRKIHDVDFFVKIGEDIVPFDLKITHISDEFFNLYKQGIIESNQNGDNFTVGNGLSEIDEIKSFYKTKKAVFNLPNYGKLSKKELLELLLSTSDAECIAFCERMHQQRNEMVNSIAGNIKPLEWWNYKYQGERLFCNNNRFFIFLAYSNSFNDGRPLKGNLATIREQLNALLNDITHRDIHTINYYYQKDRNLEGLYSAKVLSTLIIGEE